MTSMMGDWALVRAGIRDLRTKRRQQRVQSWECSMLRLLDEQAALRRAGQWSSTITPDLLSIIGRSRREVVLCSVLAWLLDPFEGHGLGSVMLDWLVGELGLEGGAWSPGQVQVTTEEVRGPRRADIIARLPGATVVFEAKVDAPESRRQCEDLYRLFSPEPDACFVFLTPRGRPPRTAGPTVEAWRRLSFRQVRAALAEALERTESQGNASRFAAAMTYLHTLEREFPEGDAMTLDPRHIFYLRHREQIETWAALKKEVHREANRFFRSLAEPLEDLAADLGDGVMALPLLDGSWPKLFLVRQEWFGLYGPKEAISVAVGLEWAKSSSMFDSGYLGIWNNKDDSARYQELHAALKSAVGRPAIAAGAKSSAWWPVWHHERPQAPEFWNELPAFREQLLGRFRDAWECYAPAVDQAIRRTMGEQ